MKKKRPSTNRGGTKLIYDEIEFKSKLEVYCYKKLKENNILAKYEQIQFELIPSFISEAFNNKKYKNMIYTPDFVGNNFIIEVKGYENERFPIVWKLFLYMLSTTASEGMTVYKVHSQKEIDNMIKEIKNK